MTVLRRGDDSWLWAHPGPVGPGAQIDCGPGDRVVVFVGGALRMVIESGRHAVPAGADVVFVRQRFNVDVELRLDTRMGPMRGSAEAVLRTVTPVDAVIDAGVGSGVGRVASRRIAEVLAGELAIALEPTASPVQLPGNIAAAEWRLAEVELPISGLVFEQLDNLTIRSKSGEEMTAPGALRLGSAVWAYWSDGWYPARVLDIAEAEICVEWEGGETWAWLPNNHVVPRER